MLAGNIALKLKNSFNKINSNIKSNKIKFDENHIPHITLLQFYTDINILEGIRTLDFNLNLDKNIEDYFVFIQQPLGSKKFNTSSVPVCSIPDIFSTIPSIGILTC